METIACDVLVIGAGVIGLAIASELPVDLTVVVIDQHEKFGQETSSRNSEVIHSGIYYPEESAKTRWCIAGRKKLYAFCEHFGIAHRRVGKIVVIQDSSETPFLNRLFKHCTNISVPCQLLSTSEILMEEPLIRASGGLLFPETGIVDSHGFMAALEAGALKKEVTIAYGHRVCGIRKAKHWLVEIQYGDLCIHLETPLIVNAAGLQAARLSNLALRTQRYEHRFCRGRYFGLSSAYQNKFKHLIYPPPEKDGLGVHVTLDLNGQCRLGPDFEWCTHSELLERV